MFPDLPMPRDDQFRSLEDLVAALRPVEILTSRLCQANFNVYKVLLWGQLLLASVRIWIIIA
jgi:hypothetical protein